MPRWSKANNQTIAPTQGLFCESQITHKFTQGTDMSEKVKRPTGGQAFPRPLSVSQGAAGDHQILASEQDGMTLRDYFAAKAMQGIIAKDDYSYASDLSKTAYLIADSMLRERNNVGNTPTRVRKTKHG